MPPAKSHPALPQVECEGLGTRLHRAYSLLSRICKRCVLGMGWGSLVIADHSFRALTAHLYGQAKPSVSEAKVLRKA